MERRLALKQLALSAGSLLALPAWANRWTPETARVTQPFLSTAEESLLAELTETLIPATDTPGAKALGVPAFVQKMLADCYDPAVQANVRAGLNALEARARETAGQSFPACDTAQRLALLEAVRTAPDEPTRSFFSLVKNLTIQGYTTSEYVMTNHYHYELVPGRYHGCVPADYQARR